MDAKEVAPKAQEVTMDAKEVVTRAQEVFHPVEQIARVAFYSVRLATAPFIV